MPIAGIITGPDATPVTASELDAALRRLRQRGDWVHQQRHGTDFGFAVTAAADVADLLVGEDLAVACDADILNRRELAAEMSLDAASGNATLIAALFRRFGADFLVRLRGSFAIAIWNRSERRLLLAVDRIGVKPLAYAATAHQMIFASQPCAIFACGRTEKRVNAEALVDYFTYTTVAAPLSAFEG